MKGFSTAGRRAASFFGGKDDEKAMSFLSFLSPAQAQTTLLGGLVGGRVCVTIL